MISWFCFGILGDFGILGVLGGLVQLGFREFGFREFWELGFRVERSNPINAVGPINRINPVKH